MESKSDSLHERGKALEDLFFKDRDKQLLENMREQMKTAENRSNLKSSSGIDDDSVIDALMEVGVNAETITTVGIIPLVAVAWADNKMEASEVSAVLKAAIENGISSDSESYQLLQSWLDENPGDELLAVWKQYVAALKDHLDEVQFEQMKKSILERATAVADAAGGILGWGNRISDVERKVLDELEAAFN